MRKRLLLITILFIGLFLILSIVNISSESGSGQDGLDDNNEDIDNSSKEDSDINDKNDNETEDNKDKNETEDKDKERIKSRLEIIKKDGETEVKYRERRIIVDENGNEREVEIRFEKKIEDGKERVKIKIKNYEADSELEIKEESENNITKIKVKTKGGNETVLKIMPDRASEIAVEKLESLNFSLQLKEKIYNNIPRVVYHIEGNKTGRFLGIFKMRLRAEADIDSETGEILSETRPWWIFLVDEEDIPEDLKIKFKEEKENITI